MLVNDFDEKKIAKIFAHYAYRNTAVEDFHAGQSVIMNDEIYQKVYEIVAGKIRRIQRNHKLLLDFKSKAEVEQALSAMYYPRAKEFFDYYNDMLAYAMFPYGSEWDEPILLKNDKRPKDLASYILRVPF